MYINDLNENHLIIIKLIDFDYRNNEDVDENSIQLINETRKIFVIFYKLEFYARMLIRICEKKINFDSFRYMIINNKFCEKQLLNLIIL